MNKPKLRFEGFHEEWKKCSIKDICEVFGRIGYRGYTVNDIVSKDEGVLTLSPTNIVGNKLSLSKNNTYITLEKYEESPEIKVYNNDILFVKTGSTLGKVCYVENLQENATINPQMIALKNTKISSKILSIIIETTYIKRQISKTRIGGAIPTLTQKEFLNYDIVIPSKEEQLNISDFFSLFDSKIQKQQEKVEFLIRQKKGLMQKIFSQELRFRDEDGEEFGKWGSKKLDQIAEVIMGQSPKGENYSMDSDNIVLIQGNADMKNGKVVPRIYTSEITKTCLPGDIIMSVRAPVGDIALTDITACIGRGVCAIRGSKFVYHYLFYFNLINAWDSISQGSTFESVNGNDIKTLVIPTPSFSEEMKIEKYLTTLERKVEKEKEKLRMLEEQKKGFMQRMFV